jgi:DNA polymerase-1
MGKEVLSDMIAVFERTGRADALELCEAIKQMNGERTVYGTVLDHLVGDRVHPSITPEQSSGRWSMRNPGLTVLGKRGGKARERAMMLADSDDEVLVAIDADQIDARMIAAMSQDPDYMALFAPGVDLHSEVSFRVWPDMSLHGPDCHQLDEFHDHGCGIKNKCHCDYRDRAKVFGHGWNYGMGPKSMAVQHGVDQEVAFQFDRGMQEAFPVLCAWKHETRMLAGMLEYGEVPPAGDTYRILHTAFGRPVRVERNRAYTQACAQLGQGSTRDAMAQALLNLTPERRRRVRAIVHDEFVMSIPKENAQQEAQAIADSMAFEFRGVQITFGCSRVARSWAGCYGDQYEEAA